MTGKDPMVMALKKLSVRWYSYYEVYKYLRKDGFEEDIVSDVLDKLTEWGYLNDSRLAGNMLTHYTSIKPSGRKLIAKKMSERGIPPEITENTLELYSEENELKCCRQLASSYASRKNPGDINKLVPSLSRFLERKGFSGGLIFRVIRETQETARTGPLDSPIN